MELLKQHTALMEIDSVKQLIEAIDQAVDQSSEVTVMGEVSVDEASHFLSSFKKLGTRLEDVRKTIVKPYNDKVSAINSFFKGLKGKFDSEETRLKTELLDYNRKQRELAEARRKAEQEELERSMIEDSELFGEDDVIPEIEIKTLALKDKNTSGISTMKVAKYRVIDSAAVPDSYKIIDESKLTKECKKTGVDIILEKAGGLNIEFEFIPGVVFWVEETLSRR